MCSQPILYIESYKNVSKGLEKCCDSSLPLHVQYLLLSYTKRAYIAFKNVINKSIIKAIQPKYINVESMICDNDDNIKGKIGAIRRVFLKSLNPKIFSMNELNN